MDKEKELAEKTAKLSTPDLLQLVTSHVTGGCNSSDDTRAAALELANRIDGTSKAPRDEKGGKAK